LFDRNENDNGIKKLKAFKNDIFELIFFINDVVLRRNFSNSESHSEDEDEDEINELRHRRKRRKSKKKKHNSDAEGNWADKNLNEGAHRMPNNTMILNVCDIKYRFN
jgi:hypothetical protein